LFIGLWFFGFVFEAFFQIAQRVQAMAFVFGDPALVNLMQRHRIQVMQFLSPMPYHIDQLCSLEQSQVLRDTLPGHGEPFTQLAQGLTAAPVQLIEQLATTVIGQGFKDRIHIFNMQPFGCICKKRVGLGAKAAQPNSLSLTAPTNKTTPMTSKRQIRYGFHTRTVFDGNNTDSKSWVGGSVDFPFGGNQENK
jgi:hypothetical protein